MLKMDKCHLPIVLDVHDEVVCHVKESSEDKALKLMKTIMSTPPKWAVGLPLDAEGDNGKRYRK